MSAIRLDRLASNLGYGSRRDCAGFVREGRIALHGNPVAKTDQAIALDDIRAGALTFDGAAFDPPAPFTAMFHKPAGYSCSHDDRGPLIYDLLPERWRRRKPALAAAGRLDKDSTGQVILTDDGELLHRITHPRTHADKHYAVTLAQPLRGDEATLFAAGDFMLEGDDKPLKPAVWTPSSPTTGIMVLHEGRYRQIRRMFASLGNEVATLHRYRTGNLELGDLASGAYRPLGHAEIQAVFSATAIETRRRPRT